MRFFCGKFFAVSFLLILISVLSRAGTETLESLVGESGARDYKRSVLYILKSYSGGLKFKKGYFQPYILPLDKGNNKSHFIIRTDYVNEKKGRPLKRCSKCLKKYKRTDFLSMHESKCKSGNRNKCILSHRDLKKTKLTRLVKTVKHSEVNESKAANNLSKPFNQLVELGQQPDGGCAYQVDGPSRFTPVAHGSNKIRAHHFCFRCEKLFENTDYFLSHGAECLEPDVKQLKRSHSYPEDKKPATEKEKISNVADILMALFELGKKVI